MNPLDLAYINRLAPYKVWTENGRDYLVETSYDLLFKIGFMDDYSIWPSGAYQFYINNETYCSCRLYLTVLRKATTLRATTAPSSARLTAMQGPWACWAVRRMPLSE